MQARFFGRQLFFELRQPAVLEFGNAIEIVLTLGLLDLNLGVRDLLAQFAQTHGGMLFGIPLRAQVDLRLAQLREFSFEGIETLAALRVAFFAQRFALDLELHHAA